VDAYPHTHSKEVITKMKRISNDLDEMKKSMQGAFLNSVKQKIYSNLFKIKSLNQ
jgi:predicted nucleic acid-binding protein